MNDDLTIEADGSEELGAEGPEVDTKLGKLKKELLTAKKEKQEYLDGWQRAKADYVNAVKRFDVERDLARSQGVAKAAKAFIGVLDTLDRAESAGEVPESFQAVAKQLHDAATSLGLIKFGATGHIFDPVHHEALGQDPVSTPEEDNTVTAVLESGWKTGHEVIRPAKVRVGVHEG
jgi:molecular chaperone GrpE